MQGTHYEQIYESRVGADTLSNTNEPSAAVLIRAQGQQIRRETAWEYLQRRCGLRGGADGQEHIERVCRHERGN